MTLYCECDNPMIDVEHDAGCRRCGLPVDFQQPDPALASRNVELEANCLGCLEGRGPHAIDCPHRTAADDERRVTRDRRRGMNQAMGEILFDEPELELEARGQDRRDSLSRTAPPAWDERGAVDVRLVAVLAGVLVVGLAVWLLWQWLVGAGVIYAAWRVMARGTRRRRPRSSWSSLGRTAAMMYAAWNSRGLVHRGGRPLRVSVPAKAGEAHVDEYGPVPF